LGFSDKFLVVVFLEFSVLGEDRESKCNEGNQSTNHVIFAIRWLPLLLLLGVGSWLLLASVSKLGVLDNYVFVFVEYSVYGFWFFFCFFSWELMIRRRQWQ